MRERNPGMFIPRRWRRAHQFYAWLFWYFWLPCPACGRLLGRLLKETA